MPLFQRAVRDSFIARLDADKLEQAFQTFALHFGNPTVQQNILAAKEEQYQEGFLNDLFVRVLGYTMHPQPQFNLITELKNVGNAGKADAAILRDGLPMAVVELKSAKVTNLQIVEAQAFAYKSHQPTARFVITSNFRSLRLYLDNAVDFEAFDLFALSADKAAFAHLYVCLHAEQLLSGKTELLKTQSVAREAQITQKLYACYSQFKEALFENLRLWNKQQDVLTLYKKSQKLLDRFLFICFAEDKGLLPHNTIHTIIEQWQQARKWKLSLYAMFTQQFRYLNDGYESPDSPTETIFAYNGGLFAPDAELDALTISDDLLARHLTLLSDYDFNSEVDTNILGHIFEHSLNELDEKTARVVGKSLDKGQSKRKKDGIFYTPTYITQFIVEQTLGEACRRRQQELGIDRLDWWESYPSAQALMLLHTYRGWLLGLTVVDPACGSGAFLNQAFIRLLAEHHTLDGMFATIQQTTYVPTNDWSTYILDHNLFGVDINEESVEIAKLSLWLRTAQIGRKLNDLGRNILCGNSLIDDFAVAADLAFDWQKSFPKVFQNGGFDVVIGNPPYVNAKGQNFTAAHKEYFYKNYQTAIYQIDTYILFIERIKMLLKKDGYGSYIIPNAWLNNLLLANVRKFVLENFQLRSLTDTPIGIFPDATVDTMIFNICNDNRTNESVEISKVVNEEIITIQKVSQQRFIDNENFIIDYLVTGLSKLLISKIELDTLPLETITDMSSGIKEYEIGKGKPPQTQKDKDNNVFNATFKKDNTFLPHILGSDIQQYVIDWQGNYLSYGEWLGAPRKKKYFEGKRLVIREIPSKTGLIVAYTEEAFTIKNSAHIVLPQSEIYPLKALLAILNSKLLGYYFKFKFSEFDSVFPKAKIGQCKNLPIKILNIENKNIYFKLEDLANDLIKRLNEFKQKRARYVRVLTSNFTALKLTKPLETWYDLDFGALRRELTKQKQSFAILDLLDQQDLFEGEKARVVALQQQIAQLQQQIEQQVYALYALAPHEIALIEKG